jgi:hypothetical protein
MAFNFAQVKRAARQAVHTTLGVTAYYLDVTMNVAASKNLATVTKGNTYGLDALNVSNVVVTKETTPGTGIFDVVVSDLNYQIQGAMGQITILIGAPNITNGIALHVAFEIPGTPVAIRARWHDRLVLEGDITGGGYAQTLEGADMIVVSQSDSTALGLQRGGRITFADYDNMAFILNVRKPVDGPFEEVWEVTRDS